MVREKANESELFSAREVSVRDRDRERGEKRKSIYNLFLYLPSYTMTRCYNMTRAY